MNYELLLSDVREVTKEKLKEISFNLDSRSIQRIKEMQLNAEDEKKLIMIVKDHSFFANMLINALKED